MRMVFFAAFLLSAGLSGPLRAQVECPPLEYAVTTYVDPVNGDDSTGTGSVSAPFRTLDVAIVATDAALGGVGQGLVYAMPGVYSEATNNEILPVTMYDRVHVSGIGAKECVLRGGGSNWTTLPGNFNFLPTVVPGPGLIVGSHMPFEIGVHFGDTFEEGDSESSIENFTFQGCDVQVYFRGEAETRGRVSNCLFDMRDVPDELQGPDFGALIVNAVDSPAGVPVYFEMRVKLFNNTFIQATQLGDGTIQSAVPQNVAICDTNDPAPGSSVEDPTTFLFGISKPSIQNNLIRDLPGHKRTAFLGIDRSDTRVTIATTPGATNAFDPSTLGGADPTGTYASAILGSTPIAKVNTAVSDPAFVGELLGQINAAASLPFTTIRDFRLMPDSPLLGRGSSPKPNLCYGVFKAGNGTIYTDRVLGTWEHGSFDWDGEGHGNFRTVGIRTPTAETDIGFDEVDTLIVAGSYGNESKSHNLPWDATIAMGDSNRYYIAPFVPALPSLSISVYWNNTFYSGSAFPMYPGLAPLAPPFIPAPGMAPSYLWLSPVALLSTAPMAVMTATDVLNPLVTHTFYGLLVPWLDPGPTFVVNEQAWYLDGSGNPILTFPLDRLTNSQSEHF